MSWFRLISTASTSLYSFFIFPYSGTHATEIFVGVACLFAFGFGLMCLNVREGEYPPPPPYDHGEHGTVAAIKTFAKETHSIPHYWYMWLFSFLTSMAGGAGMFGLYFSLALGLSMGQLGIINGTVGILVSVLTIGAGWLADRYHPIRVVLVGIAIGALIVAPSGLIWLFWHPGTNLIFWVSFAIAICLGAPSQALTFMGDPPMLMRILPRSRYGQFCSTAAFWRAMGGIIGGLLAGIYLDYVARFVGPERAYYYLPFFGLVFNVPGLYLLFKLYQSWKKLGGDTDYVAPIPHEELPSG
jgi:maltose/moltooligosaccharide transporter